MEMSDAKRREYAQRLILSRMRLLNTNGFYGLLLMHAAFALDPDLETAATDGNKIYFSPKFMDSLSDRELDFILMHEIMHIALGHCFRVEDRDPKLFNIATDIVVNSNIMRSCDMSLSSITVAEYGVSMHKAPNGKEGYEYTAEQVYDMLAKRIGEKTSGQSGECGKNGGAGGNRGGTSRGNDFGATVDSHDKWGDASETDREDWEMCVVNAVEAMTARGGISCGSVPLGIERMLNELKNPQVDWRTVLNDFVQEEICDYSFVPPDRRHGGDFFLPDYNERDATVRDVLFMIDTSGSMSNAAITAAYSEIYGAIEQFGGKLEGKLGFFDAAVIPPEPFGSVEEFKVIRPKGGGGTSFKAVFEYVRNNMSQDPPSSIIIMTDGFAPFPQESAALGVPVLWIIAGSDVKPPWGRTVRISV